MSAVFETWDATWINHVVNQPEIISQFGSQLPDGPLDLTDVAERHDMRIITNGLDAFMLAEMRSPVIYMCHSIFDLSCRGRKAITEGKKLIEWMWDNTPAIMLYGATPVENRAARLFNRWVGFTSDGILPFENVNATYDAEWFHLIRPGTSSR